MVGSFQSFELAKSHNLNVQNFMKKLIFIITLFALSSCQSALQKEAEKSVKHQSASDRINSTNSDSDNLFKEMDQ